MTLLPRHDPHNHAHWEQKLAQALLTTGAPAPPPTVTRKLAARSGEGDEQRLRFIPVLGCRGIPGAIPGTVPHNIRERKRAA